MSESIAWALLDAFADQLPDLLPNVSIVEPGFPAGDDIDTLIVGASDPDNEGPDTAVIATQAQGPFGVNRPRDERGNIFFVADIHNGDGDLRLARAAAKAVVDVVENLCRTVDETGPLGLGVNVQMQYGAAFEIKQTIADGTARVIVNFSIGYWARI